MRPLSVNFLRKYLKKLLKISNVKKISNNILRSASIALAANELVAKQLSPHHKKVPVSIGWITTWNTRCGIASYTKSLAQHTGWETKIFAPFNQVLLELDSAEVERCWTLGNDDLISLEHALENAAIDVIASQNS